MRDFFKDCAKVAVMLLCIWHMAAVGIYTVPRVAKDPFSVWTRNVLLPQVTPYMLMTSQWQLWNLFAPDPIRKVTSYRMERWDGSAWQTMETIEPGTYDWTQHATHFKLYGNILDRSNQSYMPLQKWFLQLECRKFGLPPDTKVRIRYIEYVLPFLPKPEPASYWERWEPKIDSSYSPDVYCFSPLP